MGHLTNRSDFWLGVLPVLFQHPDLFLELLIILGWDGRRFTWLNGSHGWNLSKARLDVLYWIQIGGRLFRVQLFLFSRIISQITVLESPLLGVILSLRELEHEILEVDWLSIKLGSRFLELHHQINFWLGRLEPDWP